MAAHLAEAFDLLVGGSVTPYDAARVLSRQFALLGVTGAVRMAPSLFDMAIWDALAQSRGLPLAALLGSRPRALPAYDSRGLGLLEPDRLSTEADALLAGGLMAVKLRLGYPQTPIDGHSRPTNIAAFPVAKRICRKADWFDPTGMP